MTVAVKQFKYFDIIYIYIDYYVCVCVFGYTVSIIMLGLNPKKNPWIPEKESVDYIVFIYKFSV